MARRIRDLTASEWFHVFNRGADRQDVFSADRDYLVFEELLAESVGRFSIEVHAYALMSNHFHLLLHCPEGRLSEAMQRICGRFGAAYNQRTKREGPVFTSRFKSVAVVSDAQLWQVGRYIHRNPLVIVPALGLRTYRWSSLSALIGAREMPPWLSYGTLSDLDHDASRLLDYVLLPQPADTGTLEPTYTCDDIEEAIAGRSSDRASLVAASPGTVNEQRKLLITLAVELRAASVLELADRYHVDPQSIRRTARRGRVAAATESEFAQQREDALWVLGHSRAA
jgi:REP element-mobilizing transposase RayT